MNSADFLARLKVNAAGRTRGVARAPKVASRARGDNRPDSDIDIMIEIGPEAHIGVFDDVGLKDYIAELFDAPVDVVSREGLKFYIRPAARADAISAFKTGRHRAARRFPPYLLGNSIRRWLRPHNLFGSKTFPLIAPSDARSGARRRAVHQAFSVLRRAEIFFRSIAEAPKNARRQTVRR